MLLASSPCLPKCGDNDAAVSETPSTRTRNQGGDMNDDLKMREIGLPAKSARKAVARVINCAPGIHPEGADWFRGCHDC